jgi:hypothetical protein
MFDARDAIPRVVDVIASRAGKRGLSIIDAKPFPGELAPACPRGWLERHG